jgi:hypothetical protein
MSCSGYKRRQIIRFGPFNLPILLNIAVFLSEWQTLLSDISLKRKIAMVAVDKAHCISEWLINVTCVIL